MCSYKQMSFNKFGYVISYCCCDTMEIAFYTVAVRMSKEEFIEFYNRVDSMYEGVDTDADHHVKRFGLEIDSHSRMVLTYFELEQLKDMINGAFWMMEAYTIIHS